MNILPIVKYKQYVVNNVIIIRNSNKICFKHQLRYNTCISYRNIRIIFHLQVSSSTTSPSRRDFNFSFDHVVAFFSVLKKITIHF